MRIIQVIHGYPPRYNAGSEIYTQTIARGLVRAGHEVAVFTREEDPFRPDYEVRSETDREEPRIGLHPLNMARGGEMYRHEAVDRRFEELADAFQPDVIQVGHLHHLSTSIVEAAHRRGLPVVFTLHDFWLMCPRGQFLQTNLGRPDPWALCDGQDDRKCAVHCFSRFHSGASTEAEGDIQYWRNWVHRRMAHVREVAAMVGVFVAPSRTVFRSFRDGFGIPEDRLVFLDYGFDCSRLEGRNRVRERCFVFGYIGTHIPAKGIPVLLDAFPRVRGDVRLRIWGRSNPGTTPALRERARRMPPSHADRVEWMGEYGTPTIVRDVFDRIDALVVPSIWLENSPLVIHEAQQARVPVIASDLGGMAEYVNHEVNGLLFRPRDRVDLARQMQRLVDDPELARRLGRRGYLYSETGDIPPIERHVQELVALYERALKSRRVLA